MNNLGYEDNKVIRSNKNIASVLALKSPFAYQTSPWTAIYLITTKPLLGTSMRGVQFLNVYSLSLYLNKNMSVTDNGQKLIPIYIESGLGS